MLGDEIRKRRKELGLTLKDLASLLGVSFAYVSQVERGEKNPTIEMVNKIEKALNLNDGELMTGQQIIDRTVHMLRTNFATDGNYLYISKLFKSINEDYFNSAYDVPTLLQNKENYEEIEATLTSIIKAYLRGL